MTGGVRVQGTPVTVKFGAPGRQIGSGSSAAIVVLSKNLTQCSGDHDGGNQELPCAV